MPTKRSPPSAVALAMLVLAAVVGSATCYNDDNDGNCPGNGRKQTFLTYNVGLTTTIRNYAQRRLALVETLQHQAAKTDVICLQEVWFEKDVKAVLDALGREFPYHYSFLHHSVGKLRHGSRPPAGTAAAPCGLLELHKLLLCIARFCQSPVDVYLCILDNCQDPLYELSQDCRSCVSVAYSGIADVMAHCTNVSEKFNRINRPGLLFLSRKRVKNVKYINFLEGFKVVLERGYIRSQQSNGGLILVCTHLTSAFSTYYERMLPQFQSFLQQQQAEVLKLNRTFFRTAHFLMGDLNTGPARNEKGFPVLNADAPTIYTLLTENLYYKNPYMENDGRCSFCPSENPLLSSAVQHDPGVVIDHIMPSTRFPAASFSAKRVLDQADPIVSDHYGVQLDVCWLPKCLE